MIKSFKLVGWAILFTAKTVTIDLARNLKKAHTYTFNEEEKDRIKREISNKKQIEMIYRRLSRTERLVYSIFKDPAYSNSSLGREDIINLKQEVR